MATVNWPNLQGGYNDATQSFQDYGFDLRDILLAGVAFPSFLNPDGSGFHNLETPHGFVTTDTFSGSFVVKREGTQIGTPPATIFIGKEWVDSGTITSFTRSGAGKTYGTIDGLQIDYLQAAAAASTADKSDDMAIWAQAFAGNDFLSGSNGADRLEGFSGDDTMLGGAANDTLDGGAGLDLLNGGDGNDTLYGQGERDLLTGGRGADKLYGGAGDDAFIFSSIKDSTVKSTGRDTIYDFSSRQKDKIDLKIIDANTKAKGNQAFKFIDKQDFHKKAGELQWEKVKGGVYVYGDVTGDGKADFSIFLKGLTKIAKSDFFL